MTPIHGNNCLLEWQVGDLFYPLLCATNFTIGVRQEMRGATTINTGSWKEFKPSGLSEYYITLSGLTKVDMSDGEIDWFYAVQENVRSAKQNYQLTYEDDSGNIKVISGSVWTPEQTLTADVSSFISGDIQMQGTGQLSISNIAPSPSTECEEPYADTWLMDEGENSITGEGVAGKSFANGDILDVSVEGTGYEPTDGSPGNREFAYDGTTISFEYPAPEGGQRVHVIWKNVIASS